MKTLYFLTVLWALVQISLAYKVGVGRGDCTGPPAEIRFVSN